MPIGWRDDPFSSSREGGAGRDSDASESAVEAICVSFTSPLVEDGKMTMDEDYQDEGGGTVLSINERVRRIDEYIARFKELFHIKEISFAQSEALFYAMNLLLKERKELVEAKERSSSEEAPSDWQLPMTT